MIKKQRHYTTPIIVSISYKSHGKGYGYRLVPRKIKSWVRGRGYTILKNGNSIEILVTYPDKSTNSMTCTTLSDLEWAFKAFYWEYLKDFDQT